MGESSNTGQDKKQPKEYDLSDNLLFRELMKKIEQTKKSELATYEAKTKYFLDYIFDNYGAYFIGLKTYTMSEILEVEDPAIKRYFEFVSNLLSSIPYRF